MSPWIRLFHYYNVYHRCAETKAKRRASVCNLSGALGYYLATSAGSADRAGAEFNTQYGSPEDFRRAIEELKVALPDDDAVSTDEEDLERHGNSGFAYHASQSRTRRLCLQLILKHSGDVSRR